MELVKLANIMSYGFEKVNNLNVSISNYPIDAITKDNLKYT